MNDALGDRMKVYEAVTKQFLPRRTYTIIRVDGRAFHNVTADCARPYSPVFASVMNDTAIAMCQDIQGAQFAFVQSDEISILLTDFTTIQTQPWYGGNVQKMCSISASLATAHFNHLTGELGGTPEILTQVAQFDSRVFTIPDPTEVYNYFVWRQKDATRNSIQMAAQYYFSHKELQGLSSNQCQEKLWQEKKVNWNDYSDGFKRGRLIIRKDWGWSVTPSTIFTQTNQIQDLLGLLDEEECPFDCESCHAD